MIRRRYTFWIDPEQADGLKAVKLRDGVPESEQIRRAVAAWLLDRNTANDRRDDGLNRRAAYKKRN